MSQSTKKPYRAAWYGLLFLFLYVWFTQVHPLVVFDADDWTYLYHDREAWPILGEWNPAKVFPEVFFPLCATVGNFLLLPLLKDYITVQTVTHAVVVSGFLVAFVYSLAAFLKRLFSLDLWGEVYAGALFLIFQFLALRGSESNNLYLLHCEDLNCYYNYLIPALLNGSLVLWMLENPRFDAFCREGHPGWKGIFLLGLYLAIFSNLVDSLILAVYAGAVLLISLLKSLKHFHLKVYCAAHKLHLGIFAAWLVSAVYELLGARAEVSASGSLLHRLKDTAYILLQVLKGCNGLFLTVCALLVAAAVLLFLREKGKDRSFAGQWVLWLVSIAAMTLCMVVLCAVVEPRYMYRAEYLFPIFFCCLMPVLLSFGYLLQKAPKLLIILPLLLCVLASAADTKGETFQESNTGNLDGRISAQISRDLIEQVVAACEADQEKMVLCVPLWDTENNWPQATSLMYRIRNALHAHGLIAYPIEITVEPSEEINKAHHLPTPAVFPG